jgi:hypothetical protein
MVALTWDQTGARYYETGVDHGVLYLISPTGVYDKGYAWNGLVSVTESPSGAESNPQYADNIKYLDLVSAEDFGATIEAFTYPEAFAECDGTAVPSAGVYVGQQARKKFGLAYRTKLGNDIVGQDFGYKLHLIYGALAAPSEKAYTTVNDSPEAVTFSWEVTTTPTALPGYKPTASIIIDSTKVDAAALKTLEDHLYGTGSSQPLLPTPEAVLAVFGGATVTTVTPMAPTAVGNVITIPTVAGVEYLYNNDVITTSTVTITADALIVARPMAGYVFPLVHDADWFFAYTGA